MRGQVHGKEAIKKELPNVVKWTDKDRVRHFPGWCIPPVSTSGQREGAAHKSTTN